MELFLQWIQMALEKFYSTLILILSLEVFSDVKELFEPFTAEIYIEKNDFYLNELISDGSISFQNNNFIYQINKPINQIIYGFEDQLIVQDNDFKQIMIYENNYNFLLTDVFNNKVSYKPIECPHLCYVAYIDNQSVKTSTVTAINNKLTSMQIVDKQNQVFLIKFSNLVYESTNISYEAPDDYQVIRNDWFKYTKEQPKDYSKAYW